MSITTVKTTCKIGACEPQCGMEFDVKRDSENPGGVIVGVRPDPSHPISKGYACKKGMAISEYQNDPDRLLHPMKRHHNGFKQISWNDATTEIGRKLRAIRDQYGPTAVATYWGNAADTSGMIGANTLCSSLGSPNSFNVLSLEYTDRGAVAQRMFGDQPLILQPDADKADFALLLGTNPLVTQGMTLLQRRPRIGGDLKALQQRGGKVVVVDPRVTETTKIADQHIVIRPGTDLFLLLGMLKHIVTCQLYATSYVDAHCRGLEKWESLLKNVSLTKLSEVTGITVDVVKELAEGFAAAESGFITTRVGVQTSHNTSLTEWLVQTLNAVTGNIDKPGGLFFHPGAINNVELIHKFTKNKNPAVSRIGKYPQIFGGPPASVFADDVLSDDPDRIRALIVIAGNPVISFPNTAKVEAALRKLDLLVTIDIYKSDTGSFADYNLPATTIYEKGGLHFLTQPFEPYPFAEWRHKIVEPSGEARSEWDIIRDISRSANTRFLNNPLFDSVDKILSRFGAGFTEENLAQVLLISGMSQKKISLKTLKSANGGIKMGDVPYGDFLGRYISTPDKKIDLAPGDFMSGLKKALVSPPLPTKKYPLLLISGGRRLASFNTWTHNMVGLVGNMQGNFATIHPKDAKHYNVNDKDVIRIASETGTLEIPVKVSDEIRQGVVMVHQFWGHHYDSGQQFAKKCPGQNVNHLHSDSKVDKYTGMPVFNGTPCVIQTLSVSNSEH